MARPYGARKRALLTIERLKQIYPAQCELDFRNPFELLVATILSAQSTDKTVNRVTPKLFERWPGPRELAEADPAEVEMLIMPTGFFREKTKSLRGAAAALAERFNGEVPPRIEDLVTLPGVGRKTANVVLGVAFGVPGFAVDTHVNRLCNREGRLRGGAGGGVDGPLVAADPARPADLRRPTTALRAVRAE